LPRRPASTPFTDRITAMRRRLAVPQRARSARTPAQAGPTDGGLFATLNRNWLRVVEAVAGLVVLWFLIALFQPFHGSGGAAVAVTIKKGASAADVGDELDRAGVISSSTLFQIRIKLAGKAGDLQQGVYKLRRDESYGDVIDDLTNATPPRATQHSASLVSCGSTCTVTIPEGLSRAQIALLLRKGGLRGNYLKATIRSRHFNPNRFGTQGRARNLEGFLFPDTFEVGAHAPVSDLVQLQLQDFRRRIKQVDMHYARSKNLTVYDVLIIASMIEREVQVPRERRLVAAVIYNRLHRGIPLGIDATIRFAVGNYTSPLTKSQLNSPSAYNTRLRAGLPPGPIGNPGLAAIQAAAHPAKVGYLFYVVKPGTCGEHSFSSTNAQFLRDQAAYQRALEAKGSSPTSCPG
jgi:UPF0755 protein